VYQDPRDESLEAPDNLGAPKPQYWAPEVRRTLDRRRVVFRAVSKWLVVGAFIGGAALFVLARVA
jgi:hypothetical protein